MLVRIRQGILKEPVPLRIGEGIVIQGFQTVPEIQDEILLRMDREILIPLFPQHPDKFLLQFSLALVTVSPLFNGFIFCDNGVFRCLGDDVEVGRECTSYLTTTDIIIATMAATAAKISTT